MRAVLMLCCGAMACAPAPAPSVPTYPHETEAIGTVRQSYDGALTPELAVHTFRNIHRLFPSRVIRHGATPRELPVAAQPLGAITFRDGDSTRTLEDYVRHDGCR
jgi:hypothetical protein